MILPFVFSLLFLQNQSLAAELVKRPNGYFVTGAGCGISAAQFFAFFAKTKDGRAKDLSRKMACEKLAKKGPKCPKNRPNLCP